MSEITKRDINDIVKEIADLYLDVVKEYMQELKDLFDMGDPEKVLGKKYEDWTQADFQKARAIWGNDPDITKWVAKKELGKIEDLEAEVRAMEGI